MSYIVKSYCSYYGEDEIFLVDTIEEIYYFVINHVIYPSSIYKNDDFKLEDIPSTENIKEILENNELNFENDFFFNRREILIYKGYRYKYTYYVTVRKMNDIEKMKDIDKLFLEIIKNYKNN